jgi:hypothetical protein
MHEFWPSVFVIVEFGGWTPALQKNVNKTHGRYVFLENAGSNLPNFMVAQPKMTKT